jgi:signal transduction histidine kinase
MVARYPPSDAEIGKSFADSELFTSQLPTRASGDFIGERNPAGVDQLVSFGTLERQPLVVALVHDVKAILANWRTNVIVAVAGLACLLLLLAALVAMFIRHQAFRERARQRLVQRDKLEALGRLTGGTAHDFANLLGVVNANLDLVSRYAAGDQRVLDAVTVGKRAVSSGTKLIDQMLSFAKGSSLNIATIDVNALISSRAGLLRHAAGSGVTVSFELEEHLPDCRADESQLETALVNLIVNARDALQSRGTIVIRTSNGIDSEALLPATGDEPARVVRVTVQDDGPGLSDEAREHLFEPFFTTKGDAGHGFGLSQIYGFMRQVGGDVRIDSAPGAGAAVHLDFPASP